MSSTVLTPSDKRPVRDSNIELLRILTMFGVVILHYNNASMGGGFGFASPGSANETILNVLESLFICAVNLFLLISGYFSCTSRRADFVKVFSLLLQVIVFGGIEYAAAVWSGEAFSKRGLLNALCPANYFVWLYIAVYLLSPYINFLLSKLRQKKVNCLVFVSFILFSVWPACLDFMERDFCTDFTSLSTISLFGNQQGYTVTNFLLMYLIGAWLRRSEFSIPKWCSILALAVCTGLITFLHDDYRDLAWSYHTPLVVIEAVAAFCLFRQFSFRSRVINFLAKGAFSCFLLHMLFMPQFHIQQAVQGTPLYLLCHVFFCAVVIYLLCFAVHFIYAFVSKPVISLVGKLFDKWHFSIVVNEE